MGPGGRWPGTEGHQSNRGEYQGGLVVRRGLKGREFLQDPQRLLDPEALHHQAVRWFRAALQLLVSLCQEVQVAQEVLLHLLPLRVHPSQQHHQDPSNHLLLEVLADLVSLPLLEFLPSLWGLFSPEVQLAQVCHRCHLSPVALLVLVALQLPWGRASALTRRPAVGTVGAPTQQTAPPWRPTALRSQTGLKHGGEKK